MSETVERLQGGEAGERREVGDLRARDIERLQSGEAGQRREVGDLRARDVSVCRAVRPASGVRSATCVPET